jgi:hypothetical protein
MLKNTFKRVFQSVPNPRAEEDKNELLSLYKDELTFVDSDEIKQCLEELQSYNCKLVSFPVVAKLLNRALK